MSDRRITPEELQQVIDILNSGTPGDPVMYRSGTRTREAMLAYFADATKAHASTELYAIGIQGLTSDGHPRIIALTGNGPDAEANAQKLGLALMIAPRLIGLLGHFITKMNDALACLEVTDVGGAARHLSEALEGEKE